jgi:hypothetical protein
MVISSNAMHAALPAASKRSEYWNPVVYDRSLKAAFLSRSQGAGKRGETVKRKNME